MSLAAKAPPIDDGVDAADDYFPPFADVLTAIGGEGADRAVPLPFVRFLLSALLEGRPFDEVYYAQSNPDVAAAVERGDTPSLHWHFVNVGYFEGRRGHKLVVDATWYLRRYPDIARAFARGQIQDLTHQPEGGAGVAGPAPKTAGHGKTFVQRQADRRNRTPDLGDQRQGRAHDEIVRLTVERGPERPVDPQGQRLGGTHADHVADIGEGH